jgi:DNA-binding response OmpR family regulator
MPRLNGFDVLAWWSAQPELRGLPVVVLSSSSHPSDIAKTREMGARDYIVKPHGFAQLSRLMRELCDQWVPKPLPCR